MSSRVSRRTFNKGIGAGVLAAATPFASNRHARASDAADVIVIGAGLSGLNAAWILSEAGLKTLVLEGSNRIGGRVWTAEESWTTEAGEVPIELGASQVGPSYARVLDALRRLEIPTVAEDRGVLPFAFYIGGRLIRPAEWPESPVNKTVGEEREVLPSQFARAMNAKINPLKDLDDWLDPRFADYDVSFYELYKRNGVSDAGIRLAALSGAGDIYGVSALRLFQEARRGEVEAEFLKAMEKAGQDVEQWPKNIVGGTEALPRAMAAQLPDEVRLDQQVVSVDVGDKSVEVRTLDGNRYAARFAISAIPFSILRYVAIWPRPPEPQYQAIRGLRYSETTRAFVRITEPYWEQDGYEPSLMTDGAVRMLWVIENDSGSGEHRAMFVLPGVVGRQVAARSPADAARFLVDELARIRPASRGKVEMLRFHAWERQPLQRGCSPMFAPGQITAFGREMILPHRRLHFAGEHTRRLEYGMEAAMESGERAALEILDQV